MRFAPLRPVTIHSVRYGERWFPYFFRHTDGSLLLYMQYGHDGNFSPAMRIRSVDEGRTWSEPVDNVPRQCWSCSFRDGELFEIDTYGVDDPKQPGTFEYYGAWSFPGRTDEALRKDLVRVHAPSMGRQALSSMLHGYPSFHWWPLWNRLHGRDDMRADEILVSGPVFTSGVVLEDGRALAVGYGPSRGGAGKACVVLLESRDRGHTWEELSVIAHDEKSTAEGANETTLVQLKDGRLYAVMRTGEFLYHTWSADEGKTWTRTEPLLLADASGAKRKVGSVWPVCQRLPHGGLAMVYGRPGKDLIVDPIGTGVCWSTHFDLTAWEKESQEFLGVPPDQQIRRPAQGCIRYWDSSDYLGIVTAGPDSLLVVYDVQSYQEHWNANPVSGVRLVRVRLEG
ncbi:MAG: hypothetical protein A2498_14915 [Lentisphaerae bacterium RIFOXYC12_FULL_60_16]|nr:MAG: hypothetical protein A2498_14915 [Lentisphaerae bacterium RIFOXYC12_FULL_60_16]OGV80378.1 MAG: hypothetical protein A2340_15250 [Lentisphaerae bacterium RIFOXYB12_FULL_60_10]